jgi:hypothetical protein
MQTQTQTLDQQAATIYKMFALIYNFNADEIIDSAWSPEIENNLNRHFKDKFIGLCRSEGYASANAVLRFAASLSSENASKFCIAMAQKINS